MVGPWRRPFPGAFVGDDLDHAGRVDAVGQGHGGAGVGLEEPVQLGQGGGRGLADQPRAVRDRPGRLRFHGHLVEAGADRARDQVARRCERVEGHGKRTGQERYAVDGQPREATGRLVQLGDDCRVVHDEGSVASRYGADVRRGAAGEDHLAVSGGRHGGAEAQEVLRAGLRDRRREVRLPVRPALSNEPGNLLAVAQEPHGAPVDETRRADASHRNLDGDGPRACAWVVEFDGSNRLRLGRGACLRDRQGAEQC